MPDIAAKIWATHVVAVCDSILAAFCPKTGIFSIYSELKISNADAKLERNSGDYAKNSHVS